MSIRKKVANLWAPLLQSKGNSTTQPMSQKAVSDELSQLKSDLVAKSSMLSFEEIMASTPPIDLDIAIPKASALKNYIIYEEKSVNTSFSAGTIGTRGAQLNFDDRKSGYRIIGLMISSINDSSSFLPIVFLYKETTYINFYRCTSNAISDIQISYTVIYLKV